MYRLTLISLFQSGLRMRCVEPLSRSLSALSLFLSEACALHLQ